MSLSYDEVWECMNDLSWTITNYHHVCDILKSYKETGNDKLLDCAVVLLKHYIEIQDKKFNIAWDKTVKKIHKEPMEKQDKVKKWVLPVEDDMKDNYLIIFPEDLISEVGWKKGDTLIWEDNFDGSFTLRKK